MVVLVSWEVDMFGFLGLVSLNSKKRKWYLGLSGNCIFWFFWLVNFLVIIKRNFLELVNRLFLYDICNMRFIFNI